MQIGGLALLALVASAAALPDFKPLGSLSIKAGNFARRLLPGPAVLGTTGEPGKAGDGGVDIGQRLAGWVFASTTGQSGSEPGDFKSQGNVWRGQRPNRPPRRLQRSRITQGPLEQPRWELPNQELLQKMDDEEDAIFQACLDRYKVRTVPSSPGQLHQESVDWILADPCSRPIWRTIP